MTRPTYRLTRDFVIPAGTEIVPPPTESSRWRENYEGAVAIDRDHTAYLTLDLADAIATGLVGSAVAAPPPATEAAAGGTRIDYSQVDSAVASCERLEVAAKAAHQALQNLGGQAFESIAIVIVGELAHVEIKGRS